MLIFGGVGNDGKVVATVELFDPATETFALLSDSLATPRAFHTATLLTDGTLLLAGGVLGNGRFPDDVQLWDYRTRKALSHHALLAIPREGQNARLLSNGSVRLSGGTDHFGNPVNVDEIYDPVTKRFSFSSPDSSQNDSDETQPPRIADSIPEDGASDVPIQNPIALRFSKLVDVASVRPSTLLLVSPDGSEVPAKVTAAESGRLAFVLPTAPLQPGTTYAVRIHGIADRTGERIPQGSITFTTEGEPPEGTSPDFLENGAATTQFQQLPPLQSAPSDTALAGQVLKINGWPVAGVTLEVDSAKVRTDSTGRFLLKRLTPGHHVLWVDGSTANHGNAAYGLYEVGVTIQSGKTNVLNYTIWMTRLDIAHAVNIPSPTRTETVITNPYLPGLELHLPANTVITDRKGRVVHQVSITRIPLDKPPFPLPAGVDVPIYFTIQPGGAYITVKNPGTGPAGARLIYPNGFKLKPGTPFSFWNYDADARGWYIYGHGKVSADARSVIPDPGVVIYEFTGAMVGGPGDAPPNGKPAGPGKQDADPVDLSTGQFIYSKTDLVLPDTVPIALNRTYIANDSLTRSFGIGATNDYDMFVVGDTNPYTYQELILPDGGRIRFDRISPGTDFRSAIYVHTTSHTKFYGAILSYDNSVTNLPGVWKIVLVDGTTYSFNDSQDSTTPACQAVIQIKDRFGNVVKLDRNPRFSGTGICALTKITSPNGRYIALTNDSQGRITQATDNAGRTITYAYDAAGRLSTVTDPNGGVTAYTYDDQNRMLTIIDPRGIVYLTNQYDAAGRVIQQTEADGGVYSFAWTPANTAQAHFYQATGDGSSGSVLLINGCWGPGGFVRSNSGCLEGYMPLVAQVDVTDPRGYVRRVQFGPTGYVTSDTHALGQPEEQTVTHSYYADNLLKSVTDSLGRVTSFDYDGLGNATRITRLDGTPNAVTTTLGYAGPLGQLSNVTDPLGHSSNFGYDSLANLTSATDPLGHSNTFTYNPAGQLSSIKDALNNIVQLGYFAGDLSTTIDPLGNTTTQFTDALGRVALTTDAQGHNVNRQYNPLNLVTQVTDAQDNVTGFSYDPNGNALSLTDALNHTTTWTYDNMDRVATRTDPLLRQESFSYDLMGNLVSHTDRKGQVTTFGYDPLNRLTFIGYNTVVNAGVTSYESTVSYTYDAGNRMSQAADSAGGTITDAYDDLDRLTSETTAQGSISYGYDAAGRRTSMTVAGQPQVTYTYDNADRLTQIAQGTSTVGFGYDNINRRTSLTLSNGVNVSYSYDNDSRVTAINYNFGANALGNLTYTYDSLGRRIGVGGSFARTGLPTAVASATYDAANELTNWNGSTISYDLNGNMLADASGNSFTWNAGNQVATLNGHNLQYDAYGRRIQNLLGLSLLYDGANAAQELSGSNATANLLTGGIDELFGRTDVFGSFTPLQDALGSTIALVDSNGNLNTQYSYDPFGNTSVSGVMSGNPSQYTGRENEANGLYFYRNRYYSPQLGRLLSEDPLRFAGSGPNFYSYVFDSPTNLTDPFGLAAAPILVTLATAGGGLTVIAGGAGTSGVISGTIVETGSIGGPAGVAVAGAGALGWITGRGIGHVPIGGGQTIDDGVQLIARLTLFRPDPNPGAGPLFNPQPQPLSGAAPLTGRNCKKSPDECRKQLRDCIEQCGDELRKGEWPFRRCVAKCMDDAGCDYTIPRPFYNPPPR